ncbi:MAG: hypothetical protein J4F38_06105 [Pseudomonadales bacterium]|nr:hypothetical protein [Pseudomonadales bacterium]
MPHRRRPGEASGPVVVELREWTRVREELMRERVRLTNRMHDLQWRDHPAFNRVVGDDLAAPWAVALWKRAPGRDKSVPGRMPTWRSITISPRAGKPNNPMPRST